MPFPFAFSCEEVAGSPVEKFTAQGLNVTRTFRIPWANRYDFVTDMKLNGFYTPSAYPAYPWSFVTDVTFTPEGAPEGPSADGGDILNPSTTLPDYNVGKKCSAGDCVAVVEYKPLDIDSPTNEEQEKLRAGTYATWTLGWSGEVQTVPGRSTLYQGSTTAPAALPEWLTGKLPEDTPAGIIFNYQDYQVTWHHIDATALNLVRPLINELSGRVNETKDYALPGFGGTFAKETLLFMGAQSQGTLNTDFTQTRSLTYTFRHREPKNWTKDGEGTTPEIDIADQAGPWTKVPIGWNHVYIGDVAYRDWVEGLNPSGDVVYWDRVTTATGDLNYPSGDFDRLFAP